MYIYIHIYGKYICTNVLFYSLLTVLSDALLTL